MKLFLLEWLLEASMPIGHLCSSQEQHCHIDIEEDYHSVTDGHSYVQRGVGGGEGNVLQAVGCSDQ